MLSNLVNSDGEKNSKLVALIQKNMNNLMKDCHNTPDENVMKKTLEKIKLAVEDIIENNKKYNQEGQGLKILTP